MSAGDPIYQGINTKVPQFVSQGNVTLDGRTFEAYRQGIEANTTPVAVPVAQDDSAGVLLVEQRYLRLWVTTTTASVVAGSGFLHALSISPLTATPTAGLITVFDNTVNSGTILYNEWVFATAPGKEIIIDCTFEVGISILYTTVANVGVGISYR